ncbi:MAG: hypothetical protein ACOC0A_03315 [Planctomycetota bacterium]
MTNTRTGRRKKILIGVVTALVVLLIIGWLSSDSADQTLAESVQTMSETTERAVTGMKEAHDRERFAWRVAFAGPILVLFIMAAATVGVIYYVIRTAHEQEVEATEMIELLQEHGLIEIDNKQVTDQETAYKLLDKAKSWEEQ